MNQYTLILLGNLMGATADQINDFLDMFSNLYFQSTTKIFTKVSATGIMTFQFFCPNRVPVAATVAGIYETNITYEDSDATTVNTTIQKTNVVQGDGIIALADTSLESELRNWKVIDISEITTVAGAKIWIGAASGTAQVGVYDPFVDALDFKIFERGTTQATQARVMQQAVAMTGNILQPSGYNN